MDVHTGTHVDAPRHFVARRLRARGDGVDAVRRHRRSRRRQPRGGDRRGGAGRRCPRRGRTDPAADPELADRGFPQRRLSSRLRRADPRRRCLARGSREPCSSASTTCRFSCTTTRRMRTRRCSAPACASWRGWCSTTSPPVATCWHACLCDSTESRRPPPERSCCRDEPYTGSSPSFRCATRASAFPARTTVSSTVVRCFTTSSRRCGRSPAIAEIVIDTDSPWITADARESFPDVTVLSGPPRC